MLNLLFPRRNGDGRLTGKVAIITGAASGIGKETALAFVREGCRVVLTDIQKEKLHSLVAGIGETALGLEQDVTQEKRWQEVVEKTVTTFGKLDILVNSAGVGGKELNIEECSLDEFRNVQKINVEGTFLGCKYAIPPMRSNGGGSIVIVSSMAGILGFPNGPAYSASKGALRSLAKSIALHCARYKIRCNSIHPSFTKTPMVEAIIAGSKNPDKRKRDLETLTPLGRMAEPNEIANAILFLASDESTYITGIELPVDGGLQAS